MIRLRRDQAAVTHRPLSALATDREWSDVAPVAGSDPAPGRRPVPQDVARHLVVPHRHGADERRVALQVYDITGWAATVGVVGLFTVVPWSRHRMRSSPRTHLRAPQSSHVLPPWWAPCPPGVPRPGRRRRHGAPPALMPLRLSPCGCWVAPVTGRLGESSGHRLSGSWTCVDVHRTFTPGVEHH